MNLADTDALPLEIIVHVKDDHLKALKSLSNNYFNMNNLVCNITHIDNL